MRSLETSLRRTRTLDAERLSESFPKSDITPYLDMFNAYPPRKDDGIIKKLLCWLIFMLFISFAIFAAFFTLYGIVVDHEPFWVTLNLTLWVKCIVIKYLLVQIDKKKEEYSNRFISMCEESYPSAVLYFRMTTIIYAIVMIGWAAIRFGFFPDVYWVLFSIAIIGGTFAYTCYLSTVMLFCIADVYLVQSKMKDLTTLLNDQSLTKTVYKATYEFVKAKEKGVFRINELLVASVLLNTVVLAITIFRYEAITSDESFFYAVWLVLYTITLVWVGDLCYLLLALPIMGSTNDLVNDLYTATALAEWEQENEITRLDVLHIMIAKPISVKVFGVNLTANDVYKRLGGFIVGVLSIAAKFGALIAEEYSDRHS